MTKPYVYKRTAVEAILKHTLKIKRFASRTKVYQSCRTGFEKSTKIVADTSYLRRTAKVRHHRDTIASTLDVLGRKERSLLFFLMMWLLQKSNVFMKQDFKCN